MLLGGGRAKRRGKRRAADGGLWCRAADADACWRRVLIAVRRAATADMPRTAGGEIGVTWFLVCVGASLKDAFF